jgi:glycosyltransferase involved in cell wall biosynthesis
LFGFEKITDRIYRTGIFPLLSFVIKFKPEVIHIITPGLYYAPLFLLRFFFPFKVFSTLHSINRYAIPNYSSIKGYQKFRFLFIDYLLIKFSDYVFVYSERDKRYLCRYYKISSFKVRVVKNGIRLYDIKKIDFNIISYLKIAFVGTADRREKSFDQLFEVLRSFDLPIKLSLFSSEKQTDLNIPNKHNIDVDVYEPLSEKELRSELAKNDLFILPSKYESFSICLLESMSVGLSVIVSSRVGLTERFSKDIRNVIFNKNDLNQLKNKIINFINLRVDERSQIASKNIAFAEKYSWQNVTADYVKIYNKLVK